MKRMPTEREIQDCAANELVDCLDGNGRYLKSKRTKIVKYLVEKQKIDDEHVESYVRHGSTVEQLAAFHDELTAAFPGDDVMPLIAAAVPALIDRYGLNLTPEGTAPHD